MTRKCKFCYAKIFRRKPSWLVLIECDAYPPRGSVRVPRRRNQHHTPQCDWRLRIRANMCRMFETDERIW